MISLCGKNKIRQRVERLQDYDKITNQKVSIARVSIIILGVWNVVTKLELRVRLVKVRNAFSVLTCE